MNPTPPTGPLADALARFPLVPPVPARTALPLEQRVGELSALADRAAGDGDLDAAAEVHRLAAELYFDLWLPGSAYALCSLHSHRYLQHRPLGPVLAERAVEPQLLHADLLIRAGQPVTAARLLTAISDAIGAGTDAEAAAVGTLPLAGITATAVGRDVLQEWWDQAALKTLVRALARSGDWEQARLIALAGRPLPPGPYDSVQVATIALALGGQHEIAAARLARVRLDPRTPWEHVVVAALTVACTLIGGQADEKVLTGQLVALCDAHDTYQPGANPEFDAELTLTTADLCNAAGKQAVADRLYEIAAGWALEAQEGYSARAVLRHHLAVRLPDAARQELSAIAEHAGLGAGSLPPALSEQLTAAPDRAAEAITAALADDDPSPRP
ncbi:hypothetical protein [Kitasatospora phosalacinea]|uniref:Uncharacterized protein n=1 Tax=Kitasatospora phosalacinea TaxID=2065 RepID=A0A9W6PPC8_9ACTN|nr:hypothetical protein [Kitasatospora phosalacinea]GLW58549.1 hypothetical protein Kpho01_65600 [Kitasatospora phosalacinea]